MKRNVCEKRPQLCASFAKQSKRNSPNVTKWETLSMCIKKTEALALFAIKEMRKGSKLVAVPTLTY